MIRLLPFLIYTLFSCNSTQKDLSQDLSKNLNPTKETSVIKYDNEFINRIFDCEYRNLHFMWKNGKLVSMPFEKGIDTTYVERYADNTPYEVINKYNDMYLDQKNLGEDNERSMFSFISKEDREKYVVKIKMLRVLGNLDEETINSKNYYFTNRMLISLDLPGIYEDKKYSLDPMSSDKEKEEIINNLFSRNNKILKRRDSLIKEDSRWKIMEKEVFLEDIAKQYLENNSVHPLEGIYLMNVNSQNPFKVFIYNSGEFFKVIFLETLKNYFSNLFSHSNIFPFSGSLLNKMDFYAISDFTNFERPFIDRIFKKELTEIDYNYELFTWCNNLSTPLYATIHKTSYPNTFSINWYGESWFYGIGKREGNQRKPAFTLAKFSDKKLIEFEYDHPDFINKFRRFKNLGRGSTKARLLKTFPTYDRENKTNVEGGWKGNGSGLIISKQGHIVTNHHVIKDVNSIEVEFNNEEGLKKYNAVVINSDKETDLAILKIEDKQFREFNETPAYNFKSGLADSGEKIYAYGYPMALSKMGKEVKVTDGIISSKTGIDGDVKTYQISAPIQPGNSGGPLFDDKGNLIGINSSGLSKEIADNVGYSIKTNYLLNLIDVLPEKIELPYSYTIRWISNQNQIKRLSKYTVLIKVK